jgi:hypothetical protein
MQASPAITSSSVANDDKKHSDDKNMTLEEDLTKQKKLVKGPKEALDDEKDGVGRRDKHFEELPGMVGQRNKIIQLLENDATSLRQAFICD